MGSENNKANGNGAEALTLCSSMSIGVRNFRWRQAFCRVRAQLRRMVAKNSSSHSQRLHHHLHRKGKGFRYDAPSYALNFDEGCWKDLCNPMVVVPQNSIIAD